MVILMKMGIYRLQKFLNEALQPAFISVKPIRSHNIDGYMTTVCLWETSQAVKLLAGRCELYFHQNHKFSSFRTIVTRTAEPTQSCVEEVKGALSPSINHT
jgi:hypothetical protein